MQGNRQDWTIKAMNLIRGEALCIHPIEDLTQDMIISTLKAQGFKWGYDFKGYSHGTAYILQRVS